MLRCAVLLLALAACGPPERPGIPPRHLVLVTVEGLRADRTSAWMHHRPTTSIPASAEDLAAGRAFGFDDLAGDGVLFEQAFAPSGEPAEALRAVFAGDRGLTGSLEAPDLAERLREAGFETHAWVHASHPLPEGLLQGFDRTEQLPSDLDVVRAVLPFYKQRDWGDGGRVFLWVHLSGTTPPFEPGRAVPDFHEMESGGSVRTVDCASLYAGGAGLDGLEVGPSGSTDAGADPALLQRVGALYDGEVHELALHLWTLVGFFAFETKSEAPLEDAVVALCGTGGLELDRPGLPWGLRGGPWDSGLRVPLFIRHRDSLTGRRILAEPVDLADLAPTLLEWFDCAPLPSGRDGRSLLALTDSYRERPFERRPAVAHTAPVSAGGVSLPAAWTARTAGERLVLWEDGRAELFDRLRDPREERPLDAGGSGVRERVEALRAAVQRAAGAAGEDAP